MTRTELIECMAKAIYDTKGSVTLWADALDWLNLEPNAAPSREVKKCRFEAAQALDAITAAGMVAVPRAEIEAIGRLSATSPM